MIEAGPFDQGQDGVVIPGAYDPSPYFWPIVSEPQEALHDGVFLATSARVVGGGSTINAMIFARGDAQDYEAWTKLGNAGWTWSDLLPYFIKVTQLKSGTARLPICDRADCLSERELHFAKSRVCEHGEYLMGRPRAWF